MVSCLNPTLEEGAAASEHFCQFFALYFWSVSDVLGTYLPVQEHLFPVLFFSHIFLSGGGAAKASQEELPGAQTWECGCRNPSGEAAKSGSPPQFVHSPPVLALSPELCLLLTADPSCRGCLTCREGFIPNNFQTLLPS